MTDYRKLIIEAAMEADIFRKETSRSLILKCPSCGKDKLYFDKKQGNYMCFAGGCGDKGQITKLYANIKGISFADAKDVIFSNKKIFNKWRIDTGFDDDKEIEVVDNSELSPIELPSHFMALENPESIEGMNYAASRGIPLHVALKYSIMYSGIFRRIILPIKNGDGQIVGYQARAIDNVDKAARMRNNSGFRKGQAFMFWDLVGDSDHIIVAEGPVDAIKFDLCGGNVASLGKEFTLSQIELLNNSSAKKIYWALDDDALDLVGEYAKMIDKPSYLISIPAHARARIAKEGKSKADFGECTYEECLYAFNHATSTSGKIFASMEE